MLTPTAIQLLSQSLEHDIDGVPFVISPRQLIALNILLSKFVSSREQRIALVNRLLGLQVSSTRHLTCGQANAILKAAYPLSDPLGVQEVDSEFASLISDLNMEKV